MPEFSPVSFSEVWERTLKNHSDDVFLIFENLESDTAKWTYSDFNKEVSKIASLLLKHDVKSGDSIHLALANCPVFIAVWLAAIRLGAWIVPSDPMGSAEDLMSHIERTRPKVGFCAKSRSEVYQKACGNLPFIEIDEMSVTPELCNFSEVESWPTPNALDRAAVMFTSGTTGLPKGVEITQANYAFAGHAMALAASLTSDDRQFVVLPLFHANAQYYSFASAIYAGASVALMATFSASRFLHQAAKHEVTAASLFAAPIRMILARGEPVDGLKLRHCWFAQNITQEQYETVTEWFGCRPRQLYGMTETIPAVLTDERNDPDPSSMGLVTSGCLVDLQRPDGTSVDPDEVGEIVVGGEVGITIFNGYLDAPDVTNESFRDGWFLTGDRAKRDIDGKFFFDGRRSDVLKVSGENVSIVEVESVLAEHPEVLEAAVVGMPDDIRDEVPVAFVVPVPGKDFPSLEDLSDWCEKRLTKAKRPQKITFLDELPRTSVGKIRKYLLLEGGEANDNIDQ
ncbi:MAG: putative crotonobetaine/carnitine-CoA ligase [Acidimicrobiaceae bacterium]|nr:MAG: putative crotonobetaine/carnitine-CoA ligase [Acidimicrobiaceae bacterium]|tara:strand:+ start:4041 stop:5576 length:1536 start_codon:yes stop_codon:yes gene_type:complete